MLSRVFSLQSFVLFATVESLLAIKLWPGVFGPTQNHLTTIAIIFSLNSIILALYSIVIYPQWLSPLRRLHGPKSIISVLPRALLETERPSGELFLDLEREYPKEEIISLSLLQTRLLVLKPQLLADLLVHRPYDFIKPPKVAGLLRQVLGDGLVTLEGDGHRFMRKNTLPAFGFRHIKDLYPMIWAKASALTRILESEMGDSGAGRVELSSLASSVTLDIIGIAGLGRRFNTLEKSEDPLLDIFGELLEPSPEKLVFGLACILLDHRFVRFLPWEVNKTFTGLTTSLRNICRPLIQEKRDAIAKKADDHFDILSLLIKSENFSDGELTDQLLTFLAAGHETTASSLSWACYLLATHQDMQKTLRDEVRAALSIGDASADPAVDIASVLERLPYLNGVINESLRLYPTVPLTMREAIRDTQVAEYFIPKGTTLILSIWMMNRSSEVWGPGAATFRPERWITDGRPNQTGNAGSNYDFLTFLHGPRSCIGQNFARAELRCLLAALVGSFSWDLGSGQKIVPRGVVTIKPANGLHLDFRALNG